MRNWRIAGLAGLTVGAMVALTACGTVDESFLETEANYSVDISVPYATATPLPEYLNVPDAIVIDEDGNVTLNDASVIEGDFRSARSEETQTEYRSLTLGSTGIAVQALQSRLRDLGYYEGDVTGVYDVDTEEAVKRFEQSYGTMQTGVATQKLQLRLFASTAPSYGSEEYSQAVISQYTVLRPGAVGSSVYALQQRLKALNYPIFDLTGAYDETTAQCVRLFYQAYGIAASDVADVSMQRLLYAEDARAYDPTAQPAVVDVLGTDGDGAAVSGAENDISSGATGLAVARIQQRLIELGYMGEEGDTGEYDEPTQNAINRFLQAIGREPSSVLTAEIQAFLFSESAPVFGGDVQEAEYSNLSPGDSGEAVLNLQRRLVELGYANGNPNGQYGNATISAVRLYQQANGLDADGLASAWLQATIYSPSALTYAQTQGQLEAEPTKSPIGTTQVGDDAVFFNLSLGAAGNAVEALQRRLEALGYGVMVTGNYDEATRQGVMAFQTAIGVQVTGEASASLQRYIVSKAAPGPSVRFYNVPQEFVALSPGDSGDGVTRLQQQLFSLNLLTQADVQDSIGTYNDATRNAVSRAQTLMGYESPDGVAGVEFQSFIFSKYARKIRQ